MNEITTLLLVVSGMLIAMLVIVVGTVVTVGIIQHRTGQVGQLWKARYRAMETAHKRDVATSEFLYELLLDLITPTRDETILYKARCMQVALLMQDISTKLEPTTDHIRVVLNTPTLKTVGNAVSELVSSVGREAVLEPDTVSAHDRFVELVDLLEQEEIVVADYVQDIEQRIGKHRIQKEQETPVDDGTVVIRAAD